MPIKSKHPELVNTTSSTALFNPKSSGISRPPVQPFQTVSKSDPVLIYDGRVPAIKPFQLKPNNTGKIINIGTQGIIQCSKVILPDGKEG